MDYAERRSAAAEFAGKRKGPGYEKGGTVSFWMDSLRNVIRMAVPYQ